MGGKDNILLQSVNQINVTQVRMTHEQNRALSTLDAGAVVQNDAVTAFKVFERQHVPAFATRTASRRVMSISVMSVSALSANGTQLHDMLS